MNKQLFTRVSITIAVLTAGLFVAPVVSADTCVTQYGNGTYGNTNCVPSDLTVNKKVRTPLSPFTFEENITSTNAQTYSPDSEVVFSLAVTNSGNQTFEEVTVKDTLPGQVVSAKVADELKGSFDANSKTLTFIMKDLKMGETRSVEVTTKLGKSGFNGDLDCEVTNKVDVDSEGRHDADDAKFCVRTNILGTTTLPQAGLGDYLPLMPFLAMGVAGTVLMFKKKTV